MHIRASSNQYSKILTKLGQRLFPALRLALAVISIGLILWGAAILSQSFASPEWRVDQEDGNFLVNITLPLLMAALYWAVGLWAWSTHTQPFSPIYFLSVAGTLSAGLISTVLPTLGGPWFALFQIWTAPIFLHMHLDLLAPSFPRGGRRLLRGFYLAAFLLMLPLTFAPVAHWESFAWFEPWRLAMRLNLVFAVAATFITVGYYYSTNATAVQRRWIRLLLCGTILAISPLLFLSLLPELIRAPYVIPYAWTMSFLVLNPLSYAYVIGMRRQRLRYELIFQRFASYYLAITLILGALLFLIAVLYRIDPTLNEGQIRFDLLIGMGLMVFFLPLLRRVQVLVRRIWYGREMTSQKMVTWISEALSRTMDWNSLATLLLDELPAAMVLQHCAVYAEKDLTDFALLGSSGTRKDAPLPEMLPGDGSLIRSLMETGRPIAHERLRETLIDVELSSEESTLVYKFSPAFWLPLMSRGEIHGVLMLGPRMGDDWFSADDVHVLEALVTQTGVAAHNVRLIEEVRAGRQELADAHRRLLTVREQERQVLARELHDDAVQQLIGIGYQIQLAQKSLNNAPATPVAEREPLIEELGIMNENVIDVVRSLRMLIRELRPTGLEHIGLLPTLLAYIKALQQQHPSLRITLDAPSIQGYLSEEIIMGLFRVTQESVRNSIRHARATHVCVSVRRAESYLELSVTDDGRGFEVPPTLSHLTQRHHYGLVGVAERVGLLGGTYSIESAPGKGTVIRATVPVRGERKHDNKDAGNSR